MKIPKVGKITPSNTVADFGWMNVIYNLTGGDFLKRDSILLSPIDEVLSWLIYDNRRTYDEAKTSKMLYG